MEQEAAKIYEKLAALETEVLGLRDGYLLVNKRYSETLHSLKSLTTDASEAAQRAAAAAEKSLLACDNAAKAASLAADNNALQAALAAAASKSAARAAAEAVRMAHAANASARKITR